MVGNASIKGHLLLCVMVLWSSWTREAAGEEKPQKARRTPAEDLARFEKAWQPQEGYMRPFNDAGWKARLESFRDMVDLGDKAVPVLTDALAKGKPETRTFAAQALALLANPVAQSALEKALKDSHPAVRLYAIDALSMFGQLKESALYRQLRDKDPNRDVRSHMAFALERDDKPRPTEIQKTLLDYNLKSLNTAQVGKPAPDFTLSDPLGKSYRLSQFRGRKAVVLAFIYGDT